jgi:hypothetical protein
MQAELPLARLQHWMLEVVTRPGDVDAALASAPARRHLAPERLDEMILPSATLTAKERVDIYHRMYGYRMVEAMSFDYPGVEHFLDHRGSFREVVLDYVTAHPSTSYTLNRLGDRFPDYLAGRTDLPRHRFLADLARFELAITTVFDEAESTPLSAEEIAAVPAESWPDATLHLIRAFRLLELDYPADLYLDSVKEGAPHPPLRKTKRWIMLWRRDWRVRQDAIDRRQWQVLARLASGLTLGQAIEDTSRQHRPRLTETELFSWFRKWTSIGLFSGVSLPAAG